jgi:hypothetical protein
MRPALALLLSILTILLAASAASADVRILESPGGEVVPFLKLFAKLRASGERVVIDGPCLSACTLVLMTVSRKRICVTRNAVLGFHAASSRDDYGRSVPEPEATAQVLAAYPPRVRQWIVQHGGLNSRMLLLQGSELAAMYPRCR